MPSSDSTAESPSPSASAAPGAAAASDAPAELCAANIGPRGRRSRAITGIVGLAVCTLATVLLVEGGAPRSWRLLLVLPWWTACLGVFQARSRVCVALAARGARNLSGLEEPQPAAELAAVRREARRVHLRAALGAVVLTLVSIAWP